MEQLKNMPKPYLIGGGVILVLIIVILTLVLGGSKNKEAAVQEPQITQEVPEAIPTVDASVEVNFERLPGNDVTIKVASIPSGTESIDYELSYETVDKGLQGVIGQLEIDGDKAAPDEEIFLGTASSGTKLAHNVTGPIKVTLRFSGSYGEQLFEKEYDSE